MDGWRDYLAYANADREDQLWNYANNQLTNFENTSDSLLNYFGDEMDAVFDNFCYGVEEQIYAKEDFAQETIGDWAAWLEYLYGYTGYEGSFPSASYAGEGDNYGPGGKDGAFSGYTGGYGYGGSDDYLFAGEHVGLAHGTDIGPNRDYFPATIFDDEIPTMAYAHDAYSGLGGEYM